MNNYLTKEILNEIENKITELQGLFLNKFQLSATNLRNIHVGDSLNSKIIYLSFPWNSYETITSTDFIEFITTENYMIRYRNTNGTKNNISFFYDGTNRYLYAKNNTNINNYINYIRYRLPKDYGKVTHIDDLDPFYEYIKIVDNSTKLLLYTSKEWKDNEIPYLQDIDRIEQGIENIAELFFKPNGYESKIWTVTGTCDIENSDYGLSQKPISYKDFERWKKNIELLASHFNDFVNVWNVVSYINWNEENKFEWEEF
ncbi:MAG: hypothetical protein MR598_03375 [Erysipelotrichaceae bacterium]|nr:hypothetical protein [Erysipelotrichaceae bacterium]